MLNCSVESSLTLLKITSKKLIGSLLILFIYFVEFILKILWYVKINTLLPRLWRTRGNNICMTSLMCRSQINSERFFRRNLDLGSVVLFLFFISKESS